MQCIKITYRVSALKQNTRLFPLPADSSDFPLHLIFLKRLDLFVH